MKPTIEQMTEFWQQVKVGRITRSNLQAFLESLEGIRVFDVSVAKGSLADLIIAGHYDWVNDNITAEHFSLDESQFGGFKLVLVHLDQVASTDEVLAYLQENNLEPAKIGHLLGFGAKYPDIQREFPIIALGSSWVGPVGLRSVPYLDSDGAERSLRLAWGAYHWRDRCRFLALRKK